MNSRHSQLSRSLQLSIAYTQRFKGEKPHPFVNAVNCRRKFLQCKKKLNK